MLRIVARDRSMAVTSAPRSPLMSVTEADSMATSVPRADRHADVGLGQRGRVVDAVADHRDELAAGLQAADLGLLLVGPDVGQHALDAQLAGNGARRGVVVAGQHHHVEATAAELRHGRRERSA